MNPDILTLKVAIDVLDDIVMFRLSEREVGAMKDHATAVGLAFTPQMAAKARAIFRERLLRMVAEAALASLPKEDLVVLSQEPGKVGG